MRYFDLVDLAESIAQDSRDPELNHQVVAFCVRGGKVIAHGTNQKRYRHGLSVFDCSVHAEMALLDKLRSKASGAKIYVYRFNVGDTQRLNRIGKPCTLCQHGLKKAGVAKVYYVDDDGELCCMKNSEFAQVSSDPYYLTRQFLRQNIASTVKFVASNFIVS